MHWNLNFFSNIRDKVGAEVVRIQRTAKAVAALDVFASLALVAQRNNFVRPKINETGLIDIRNGRHPVVEQMIENDMFIPNDTYLDNHKKRISLSQARIWQVNPLTCARQLLLY